MREIKFRAWDKDGKEMIEANDFYQKADPKISGNGLHLSDFLGINKDGTIGKEHENIVLMQYTGLKDKNGKEIYEGDIVEFTVFDCFDNDTQYKGCIVWAGTRFMIWSKPDYEFYGSDGGFDLDWAELQDDEFEVIGNIYENPELVERKL